MNRRKIKRNAAKCGECGDEIESKYRHDFVTCKCGAISVDGGLDYLRRSFKEDAEIIELSEYDDDDGDTTGKGIIKKSLDI